MLLYNVIARIIFVEQYNDLGKENICKCAPQVIADQKHIKKFNGASFIADMIYI